MTPLTWLCVATMAALFAAAVAMALSVRRMERRQRRVAGEQPRAVAVRGVAEQHVDPRCGKSVSAAFGQVARGDQLALTGQRDPKDNGLYVSEGEMGPLRRADEPLAPGSAVYDAARDEHYYVRRHGEDTTLVPAMEHFFGAPPEGVDSVLFLDRSAPAKSRWVPASDPRVHLEGGGGVPRMSKDFRFDMTHKDADRVEVPRVMHFVYGLWDDAPMPQAFADNMAAWKAANPGFGTKVWDRAAVEELVRERYPEAWDVYRALGRNVQRADLARYLIVYDRGGWYADLDCVPAPDGGSSLDALLSRGLYPRMVLLTELEMDEAWAARVGREQPIRNGEPEHAGPRFANYFFGATKRHPFMRSIIDTVLARCRAHAGKPLDDYGVLYTTGPDAFTTAYYAAGVDHVDVKALPLGESRAFCRHGCTGTWRDAGDK